MQKKNLTFLLFFIGLSLSAQINIREEDDSLIINEEKIIKKGSLLTITNNIFYNLRLNKITKPSTFRNITRLNIQSRQILFRDYQMNTNSSIIGKKVKIIKWDSYYRNYILTVKQNCNTYKILLDEKIELEDIIVDNKNKNSH